MSQSVQLYKKHLCKYMYDCNITEISSSWITYYTSSAMLIKYRYSNNCHTWNYQNHRLEPWSGVSIYIADEPPIWERVVHFGRGLLQCTKTVMESNHLGLQLNWYTCTIYIYGRFEIIIHVLLITQERIKFLKVRSHFDIIHLRWNLIYVYHFCYQISDFL